jgi:ribose transport system permease protein
MIVWRHFGQMGGLLLALAGLILIFSLMSHNFFSLRTLISIGNQIPDLTFLAVGMTLVLVAGGIDLSVGSVLALCSAVLGIAMVDGGMGLFIAVLFAALVGLACGLVSGSITVFAGVPAFIVTLGMLEVARGLAYLVTDSQTQYIGVAIEGVAQPMGLLGVSPAFMAALLVVVAGHLLLTRTVYGRYLIAVGTNEEAVRMSGINPRPYRVSVFALSGLLCALAAVSQSARLASADPNAAVGLELSAIAAAVIGGTSLLGGRGSVVATFIGVLIISVLQTGLAAVGVDEPGKRVITGSVIVVAALLDVWRNRR